MSNIPPVPTTAPAQEYAWKTFLEALRNGVVAGGGLTISASSLGATGGYISFAWLTNKFIIQWGQQSCVINTVTAITFPIAFPNACVFGTASLSATVTSYQAAVALAWTTTGMNVRQSVSSPGVVEWLVVGY